MKYISFEDYLEEKFVGGEGGMILDDDLSDAFDGWIADLDADELIKFGEQYGELRALREHEGKN